MALTRQNRTLFFKVGYAWVLAGAPAVTGRIKLVRREETQAGQALAGAEGRGEATRRAAPEAPQAAPPGMKFPGYRGSDRMNPTSSESGKNKPAGSPGRRT